GSGQLLGSGQTQTASIKAHEIRLASTGGVGKQDQSLHASVDGLHGDFPLAGIHLLNDRALQIGDLTVVDDNLLVVAEGAVTIDGPLVADGGGNLSIVANGLSATLHVQAPVRTSGGDGNINLVGSGGVELDTQLQYHVGTSTWDDFIRQAGPAGYWKLDEAFGTVASEALGRDLDGFYAGDVTLNQSGAVRSGSRNSAIDFPGNNGSGNTVSIADDARLYGGRTQTVTGWLKVDSLAADWQAIYFKGDAGAGTTDFTNNGDNRENVLWVNTSGYLHYNVALDDGAGQRVVNSPTGLIQAGQWYHFATVVDASAGNQKLFVNGELVGSGTIPSTRNIHNTSGAWRLGNSPSGESSFNGALDDFAVFNKVLSAEQIKRQYLAGVNATGAVTFAEAQDLAEQRDGWLAVLHNEEMANAASTVVGSQSALAGGTDENHEGDWRWVGAPTVTDEGIAFWQDNQTQNDLVQYWNTATGEPNGGINENILEIESGTRKWNDLSSDAVRSGYLLQVPTVYSSGHGQVVINAGTQYRDGQLSVGNTGASITMKDGVSVTSEYGNLVLLAASDVLLSNLKTETDSQGAGGNVLVVADYDGVGGQVADGTGSIRDHLSGDLINIKANGVILSAEGGGNSSGLGIGLVEQPLLTDVVTLAATTDLGDIAIDNQGDLTIGVVDIQLTGLLADVLNWRDIVPVSQLPARISDLVDSVETGAVVLEPGQFLMGGLSILDSDRGNTGRHDISVNSSDSLTVTPGIPVVNLDAGSIILSSLRDAEPNSPATFEVIPGNFTWEEAQANAAARGGWLANITSAEVQDYINNNVIAEIRSDITSPGIVVTPTSQNSPAAEQSPNAIDNNVNTKYLNFDKLNAGLTITTGGGVVAGLTLTSANDAPERDPRRYKLEGSNNGGVSFDLISEASIPAFSGRFTPQTVNFSNEDYYRTYRLTFPEVANSAAANSMQIAEVELLGVNRQYWTGGEKGPALGSDLIFDSFEPTSTSASSRSAGNSLTTQITTAVDTLIGSMEVLNEMSTGGFLKFLIFDNARNLVFQTDPLAFAADTPGQPSWKKSAEFAFNLEAGATYNIGAISDSAAKWNYDVIPTSQNGISSVSRNVNISGFTSPQFYSFFFGVDGATRLYAPASAGQAASIADGWNWVDVDETVSFDRFGYTNWNADNPGDDSDGGVALYANGKWADVPQAERMSYILQRPVPGELNINTPVFSSGGQGNVFLYEGYRSLRIPVPLNENSDVSYYHLNVAGALQENGVVQLSLSANQATSPSAAVASVADLAARSVKSQAKTAKKGAPTLQKDGSFSKNSIAFVGDDALTDSVTTAPDDTAVGAGVRFFWNTDKQLRDAAGYEDGTLLSDAEFRVPDSGTRTFYLRVLYPDNSYTDYQKTITIPDVAPENLQLQFQETPVAPGTEQTLAGTFSDTGINDQHRVQIDWGDGSPVADSVLLAGIRSFEETHTYSTGGKYEATVTVTDTESGERTVSQSTFYVTGVGLANGVLSIVGTEAADTVVVSIDENEISVSASLDEPAPSVQSFATEDIQQISFTGFSGDDTFITEGEYPIDMHVFGGPGDDFLVTGSGEDVVTDLNGNNDIRTSYGDDTILTGPGNDQIESESGDDTIRDLGGDNRIDTDSGADTVLTGDGNDEIFTGTGNDIVRSVGGDNTIQAGADNDTVETGAGDDDIVTESGNDTIIDLGGENSLSPGLGTNHVSVLSADSVIEQRSPNDQATVIQPEQLQPVKLPSEDPLTARFAWLGVPFADGFQIRVDDGDTQDEVLRTFTTASEFATPNELPDGSYTFAIRPVRLISDQFVIAGDWTEPAEFEVDSTDGAPLASIAGRHLFYNDSRVDDPGQTGDSAENTNADGAIATDKAALQSGTTATFANYSNYSRGINGIMVDIADAAGTITSADFEFRVGNTADPSAWAVAPAPNGFAVRSGAGANGSDRVTFTWADGVIKNQWLQVTVKANANTRLATDDVHYWGNQVGETGNNAATTVNFDDMLLVLDNPSGFTPVLINNPFDINRDSRVNIDDAMLVMNNLSGFSSLLLFNPPAPPPPSADSTASALVEVADTTAAEAVPVQPLMPATTARDHDSSSTQDPDEHQRHISQKTPASV
ncbi:MAG: PKD domain-containing protein, partial [Fuerstiella sp.]|nr:PKD domain-containing protein [Fuerstiella sp.]